MWSLAVDHEVGVTAAITCIAAWREAIGVTVMAPRNRNARTAELQGMPHAGAIAGVHVVADGVAQYCAEYAPDHHADDAIVASRDLSANDRAGHATDDRADFVAIAAAGRDAVVVHIDDPALAPIMSGMAVQPMAAVIVVVLFVVAVRRGVLGGSAHAGLVPASAAKASVTGTFMMCS